MHLAYLFRLAVKTSIGILLVFVMATPLNAQRGAMTRTRNLGELVAQSSVILRGNVVNARVGPHPELTNLFTLVITLRVREVLKGDAGPTFTFRQYIWDIRDRYDLAGYKKGQVLLLLMNPPTRYGLSSPAGLEQGRFRILRDQEGRERAVNGHGNAGLFRDLEQQLTRKRIGLSPQLSALVKQSLPGPLALESLRGLIRELGAANLK